MRKPSFGAALTGAAAAHLMLCRKPIASRAAQKKIIGLQTKLRVNELGDAYEQEADRVAAEVMAELAPPGIGSAPPRIRRFSGQSSSRTGAAPASVDRALASPGTPLEPALRQDMEQRFCRDFSWGGRDSGAAAEPTARDGKAPAYHRGDGIA